MKSAEKSHEDRENELGMKHLRKRRKRGTTRHRKKSNLESGGSSESCGPMANSRECSERQVKCETTEVIEEPRLETSGNKKSWRLSKSFAIRPPVSLPFLTGCDLNGRILIRDLWSDELYLANIKDATTGDAFVNQLKGDVFYCTTLGDDKMVYCDSKSGLVHICSTVGQHIKTIAITHRPSTHMYHLTVDSQGRIVFGVRDGKIFIIDPLDNKIVSSFGVDCKIESIGVTSSGYIVIKSGIAKFNIIRNGVIVHTLANPDWSWAACVASAFEDIIYVAYSRRDDPYVRRLMELQPTGDILEDGVLELEGTPHRLLQPSLTFSKRRQIVVCDNGKLQIFEKNAG